MTLGLQAFLLFLAIVLMLYHTARGRSLKFTILLLASWGFYVACSPPYLGVLLFLTLLDYWVALRIEDARDDNRRRRWLVVSLVSNLGLLVGFKYTGLLWDTGVTLSQELGFDWPARTWEILLPLGISFHTFQGISYTVDVYRKQVTAVRSFRDYALFVAFFPQMAAGPIVRAVEFLPQLVTPPTPSTEQLRDGLALFIRGLVKKLIIADHLDLAVSAVFNDPSAYSGTACRIALFAWAVQIYCDFSGYSDIAVGTAKWFGFDLPNNFDLPYLATSMTDFWRRWHLSFSTWLRDYLYFPLGGSRGSEARTVVNLLIVFLLCGLWHGASWAWVVYGLYYGLVMCLHRWWDRLCRPVAPLQALRKTTGWALFAWACTFTQLLLGLILVRMPNWAAGGDFLMGVGSNREGLTLSPLVPGLTLLGLLGHLAAVLPRLALRPRNLVARLQPVAVALGIAGLLVFSPGVSKTFIYIQF